MPLNIYPYAMQGLVRPDDEEVEKTRKETQAALDKIVGVKIQAAQPTSLAPQPNAPTYIKYTPAQQGSQYNSGAAQRIIKMQDMPVDPMEPPKFRAKKACPTSPLFPSWDGQAASMWVVSWGTISACSAAC